METIKNFEQKHPVFRLGIEVPQKKSKTPSPNLKKNFFQKKTFAPRQITGFLRDFYGVGLSAQGTRFLNNSIKNGKKYFRGIFRGIFTGSVQNGSSA